MTAVELLDYARCNWAVHYKTVSEISKNKKTGHPLVESDVQMYDFDEITKDLFPNNSPASADGLLLTSKKTILVEFKSGFFKKITKDTFDSSQGVCKHLNAVCEDYWNLFFKSQKLETQVLIDSLKMKAAESYTLLEKHIIPACSTSPSCRITLVVVIDCNSDDGIEDTLAELAKSPSHTNQCSQVRNSLTRFLSHQDYYGNSYYYIDLKVMSPCEFQAYLSILT